MSRRVRIRLHDPQKRRIEEALIDIADVYIELAPVWWGLRRRQRREILAHSPTLSAIVEATRWMHKRGLGDD